MAEKRIYEVSTAHRGEPDKMDRDLHVLHKRIKDAVETAKKVGLDGNQVTKQMQSIVNEFMRKAKRGHSAMLYEHVFNNVSVVCRQDRVGSLEVSWKNRIKEN